MYVWQGPYKMSWSVVWQEIQADLNRAAFWLLSWRTVCALIRLVFIRLTRSVTMGTDQSWTLRTLCLAGFFDFLFAYEMKKPLLLLPSPTCGCCRVEVAAETSTCRQASPKRLHHRDGVSTLCLVEAPSLSHSLSLTVWTSVSPRSVNDGCVVLVQMMRLLCVNPPPPPHPALCLRLTTWWPGWASPCEWPSCEAQCLWGLLAPCLSPD